MAGRPGPQGWYSEPWWKPALVAGAWGVGSYLVASMLFSGMALGYRDESAPINSLMTDRAELGEIASLRGF
mgnify:CR=1 FL=1